MALTDLRIPIGTHETDEMMVTITDAGEVELRQLGQVVTIARSKRVEVLDALVVAYKAVDQITRRQEAKPREV